MNAEHPVCLGPPVLASATRVARFTKQWLWGTHSLPAIFHHHADAHGDTRASTDYAPGTDDATETRRELTYAEVDVAVRHIAARFESCGLKPGDIVALQLPPQSKHRWPASGLALSSALCQCPGGAWRSKQPSTRLVHAQFCHLERQQGLRPGGNRL